MKAFNIIRRIRENRVKAVLLVFVLCLVGCVACLANGGLDDRIRGKVVQELPQPGGGFTAIFTKDTGGWATNPIYYRLYLRWPETGYTKLVFSVTDNDADPKVRWESADALVVHMTCGTIMQYQNMWEFRLKNAKGYPVFIGLEGNRLCKHFDGHVPGL
ncbi:MAG TPA: hypothetical protein VHC39_16390 [Rhizomicrobium sp.]|nr:hypothetical protein [Rhizomicrobium sp.]